MRSVFTVLLMAFVLPSGSFWLNTPATSLARSTIPVLRARLDPLACKHIRAASRVVVYCSHGLGGATALSSTALSEAISDAESLFAAAVAKYQMVIENGVSDSGVLAGFRLFEAACNADFEVVKAAHYLADDSLVIHSSGDEVRGRKRVVMNVTCMQPCPSDERSESAYFAEKTTDKGVILSRPVIPGRRCRGGCCSEVRRFQCQRLAPCKQNFVYIFESHEPTYSPLQY
jgi:hypothetical protein